MLDSLIRASLFGLGALACIAWAVARAAPGDELLAERVGEGDSEAGEAKAAACAACHGAAGEGRADGAPRLAGQFAAYQLKQIDRFRYGVRRHHEAADTVTDRDDLQDIAAWFASRPLAPASPGSSSDVARRLFAQGDAARELPGCASCHGDDGSGRVTGSDANPAIGGQFSAYLQRQLLRWKRGELSGSSGMGAVARSLDGAEIDALAAYVAGLSPAPPSP